ncbi:MAG: PD40 domain-containing protein [Bryobacterales bacterium]|nr:PD40 domain-containing protein [Bryobacterales bacterium]
MRTLLLIPLFLFSHAAAATADPLLLQKPALSKTQIVFTWAGDLWTVSRSGGDAVRLTSGTGHETDAAFSPDGTQVAFTGEYDGNVDVFVVAAGGGVPKRLTWHPSPDRVLGWTPDGKGILFASARAAASRYEEMFRIGAEGGVEERLPFPRGTAASLAPDGQSLAYEPLSRAFTMWKEYRGGATSRIWLGKLSDSSVTPIPRTNSNDFNPLWAPGDRVYFLSDRNGPVTLFRYDVRTKQVQQAVANKGLDVKSASLGPDAIVYAQFGEIHLYDLKTGASKAVPIRVKGDMPEMRARLVNVGKRLMTPAVSPNAARAVFAARGEILTVPAEHGDPRNLTNTPGVAERSPVWSPDGKTVAYLSDESGEYALHLSPQTGLGAAVKKVPLRAGFYSSLAYSPDSRKMAMVDSFGRLWYVELESGKQVEVAQDHYQMRSGGMDPAWSPDSKWLAYSQVLPSGMSAIYLYSLAEAKSTRITDGLSNALSPVFEKGGKYLWFTASTNAGEALGLDIQAIGRTFTSSIYMAVLDRNEASPFAPRSDEEKTAGEDKPKPEAKPAPKEKADIRIDLEGIDQRILAMPMPARNYAGLAVGKAGVLLALERAGGNLVVHRYDLTARKGDSPLTGLSAFVMAAAGEKALYRQGDNWFIAALRPLPPGSAPAGPTPPAGPPPGPALRTSGIEVQVDPASEWRQMYKEAFRLQRDHFYDRNFHGFDLGAAEKRYEPWLENVASRRDLTFLFQEALGGLVVSHLGTGGGDVPEIKQVQTGLLGADYEVVDGRYRFTRVYSGENWNPQLQAPLTQPGVNVKAGDVLLAVNGREVRATENVYRFFEGLGGKAVVIRVAADAQGTNARDVTVTPIANEFGLRNRAWIEDNRRRVEKLSGGKLAYVYMPDTAFGGQTAFLREFYAQIGKEGVVIDERYNGGGLLATDVTEILNRKVLSAAANRAGTADIVQPQGIFGPKVMIINETAGSGGDAMPWYFRRSGAGKLVGTRTWGGLVGMAGTTPLIDGGYIGSPSSGIYNPLSGEWEVENVGVGPDIEVEQDPALVRKGQDPQLEKAVAIAMEELKKNPLPKLRRPAFPNYYRNKTQTQ